MTVSFGTKLLSLSSEERQMILNMLPSSFETRITDYSCSTKGIVLEIRTNINNKKDALCWKKEFEEKTKTSFNSDSTFQENTQKTVFKRVYHCLHNTRPKSSTKRVHYKNTKCQAKLIINVKQKDMKRSKDIYLKEFPCKINLRQEHNHRIDTADALRHKKPSDDVREKFVQLFSNGYSPSLAPECIIIELQDEEEEDCISTVADQELLKQTEVDFIEAMNLILTRFRENPSLYLEPMNRFCQLVKGIKTDSAMISALHTFGKYSGLPIKKNCQGSRKIGVQPRAVARRKVLVGGRNVAISGRPPKRHEEHEYSKRKRTNVSDLPPTKKSKVSQSLSVMVDNNNI